MPTETKILDKTCASFLWEKNGTWDFAQPVVPAAEENASATNAENVENENHLAPIKLENKKWKCPYYCGYESKQNGHVYRHIKTKHLGR